MAFSSTIDYSNHFLKTKQLLFDSDVLIDIAKIDYEKIFADINQAGYKILIAAPSIIEVGMGNLEVKNSQAYKMSSYFYNLSLKGLITTFEMFKIKFNTELPNISIVIPDGHEWFSSKNKMIDYIEATNKKSKNWQDLKFDAVIYACAWNSISILITNNKNDFMNFNKFSSYKKQKRYLPIYNFQELERVIYKNEDVVFDGNF